MFGVGKKLLVIRSLFYYYFFLFPLEDGIFNPIDIHQGHVKTKTRNHHALDIDGDPEFLTETRFVFLTETRFKLLLEKSFKYPRYFAAQK